MSKTNYKSKMPTIGPGELLDESQFIKKIPKSKKRQLKNEEEVSELISSFGCGYAKKKKIDETVSEDKDMRQLLLEVMDKQLEARKQNSDGLLKQLSELTAQAQEDHDMLLESQNKLKHLVDIKLKLMQQTVSTHKQKIKSLNDIHSGFKKQCEELHAGQRTETHQLVELLHAHMAQLHQKLLRDAKRRQLEKLRNSIFDQIQNDF